MDYTLKEFFVYTADSSDGGTLSAGASYSASFNIEADSDFEINKLTFAAFSGGSLVASPEVTVYIQNTGSGRYITAKPIDISALFGSGELPFILPIAGFLPSRASVNVQFANNSAATDFDSIRCNFIGKKLYR